MNGEPLYDHNHTSITVEEALLQFAPQKLKVQPSQKISKSQVPQTRWESRDPNAPLGVLDACKYFLDLCWWRAKDRVWVYINSRKKTCSETEKK